MRSRLVAANALVEVAAHAEAGERGELVHDDVGPRGHDGVATARASSGSRIDRLGAEPSQHGRTVRRAGGADDVVAAGDELGDEAAAEGAARTCEKDA